MAEKLNAFLRHAAAQTFKIGSWDCGFWVAEWVKTVTGCDPVPEFRAWGAYDWNHSSRRLPVLARALARRAGLSRTTDAKPGDIAIVRHGSAFYGVIKSERGWAALAPRGIASGPLPPGARVVAAWSVP